MSSWLNFWGSAAPSQEAKPKPESSTYHAAHVIVGLLNTHKYRGLQAKSRTETGGNMFDFAIAVRVYDVASKNELTELMRLAAEEFGTIGKELDFSTIIKTLSSNECAGVSITGTLDEYLSYRTESAGQTMTEQDAFKLKNLTAGTIAGAFSRRVAMQEMGNKKLKESVHRK
ncbi:hypothetical protein NW762_007632 [Fusarium torreyae]|uniref:Uncharacterized protein n=1 Tax=Fusarium torreyae TaxID=1237075 RepID=A0A9W8VDN3_9HYPO|nr:hypothetical protein NW762_007632 [Fusarium torreyae]